MYNTVGLFQIDPDKSIVEECSIKRERKNEGRKQTVGLVKESLTYAEAVKNGR